MNYYQGKLASDGFLVAVRSEDEAKLERAKIILQQSGGSDIDVFRLTKKLT